LVQLEVADRLAAKPASSAYGALSVFVQRAYDVKRALTVKRGAFYPAPRVDSAVVVLSPVQSPLLEETDLFRELVSRAFQKRRKQLRNAWSGLAHHTPAEVTVAAGRAGIELSRRGETLGVAEFARMTLELGG
jgi:16S rRNA (adenine1518-N6/adenine1519-N6)-dimethyltransferase